MRPVHRLLLGRTTAGLPARPLGRLVLTLTLFALGLRFAAAQTITEYPLPEIPGFSSGVRFVTAGPDGNVWYTRLGPGLGNRIGRITPSGLFTEFELPTSDCDPRGIALGPDRNLWFAEFGARSIGRITPTGNITEFTSPGIVSPQGITAGPDGHIWFTDWFGNQIGRVTVDGASIVLHSLRAGIAPYSITAGPDGNLWFTEVDARAIGRITPSGVITEFPLTSGGVPVEITSGPDGNLWFTEQHDGRIGRITPQGIVTEFPIPAEPGFPSLPTGIAAGSDGSLWWGDVFAFRNGRVGRITTTGAMSFFELPDSQSPWEITSGPDGNIWFTVPGANLIGKLEIVAANVPTLSAEMTVLLGIALGAVGIHFIRQRLG
jgi:streptogramin lyase